MQQAQPHGALREGLAIRDALPEDALVIAAIYNESVAARGSSFDLEEKSAEYFAAQLAEQHANECFLLLEDIAGVEQSIAGARPAVLGFGKIERYSPRLGYRYTAETAVYLWRRLARRGYGSMLKLAVIERCRELGYHHLVAKIVADNTASLEYNKRFGYSVVGTQREVGLIDGRWRDVTIMQLILDEADKKQ